MGLSDEATRHKPDSLIGRIVPTDTNVSALWRLAFEAVFHDDATLMQRGGKWHTTNHSLLFSVFIVFLRTNSFYLLLTRLLTSLDSQSHKFSFDYRVSPYTVLAFYCYWCRWVYYTHPIMRTWWLEEISVLCIFNYLLFTPCLFIDPTLTCTNNTTYKKCLGGLLQI